MRKVFILIGMVFVLSMALLSGCKVLIDQDDRVLDTCYIFDAGLKGNSYKLSTALSRDFAFVPNETFINAYGLTSATLDRDAFTAFVEQGVFKNEAVVAFSNIVVSGVTAAADMRYFDLGHNICLEVSLRDEGDFIFESVWKVANLYVREIQVYTSTSTITNTPVQ